MQQRTAIVTGAGTGIGRATAITFLEAGWNTVLAGRRLDKLEETASQAAEASGKALAVSCDVSDPASVDALFEAAAATFGRVDCLFNNAQTIILYAGKATVVSYSREIHDRRTNLVV